MATVGVGMGDAAAMTERLHMSYTKPILAVSSLGFGAALMLMATHIQRDRFAFTGRETRNSDVPAVTLVPPPPQTVPEPIVGTEVPALRIEPLKVVPETPPELRTPPTRTDGTKGIEPTPLPCRPTWRELESGPAGRMVRDICEPAVGDGVPRS